MRAWPHGHGGNGTETVFGGGVASATILGNAGSQVVVGGSAVSATVGIGGKQTVEYGGFLFQTPTAGASFDTEILGGVEEVASGGIAHATEIIGLPALVYSPATSSLLIVDAGGFEGGSAAMQDANQVGANTVFAIDANNSVTLDNVTKSSLTAGNFHFSWGTNLKHNPPAPR